MTEGWSSPSLQTAVMPLFIRVGYAMSPMETTEPEVGSQRR